MSPADMLRGLISAEHAGHYIRPRRAIQNARECTGPTTATSIRARGCSLQNWRPPGDFGLYEPIERCRVALFSGRDRGSEIGQTFRNDGIVESFVQRCGKLAHDLLRHALGRENASNSLSSVRLRRLMRVLAFRLSAAQEQRFSSGNISK